MKRAFTILELLASTALTALLMLAVLHIIASLGASRAALERQPRNDPAQSDLFDNLRRDLTNASQISYPSSGITLVSSAALDPTTLAFHHEPVTVTYGVVAIHGRSWLVRRQSPRGGLSNQPPFTELVCPGITNFNIRPLSAVPLTKIASAPRPDHEPIPPIVEVTFDDATGQRVAQTLVLR